MCVSFVLVCCSVMGSARNSNLDYSFFLSTMNATLVEAIMCMYHGTTQYDCFYLFFSHFGCAISHKTINLFLLVY